MKLDVCDRCKKFNVPGKEQISITQLSIYLYPPPIGNSPCKFLKQELCSECRDQLKELIEKFCREQFLNSARY